MHDQEKTVQAVYEALTHGDASAVMDYLADDVVWEYYGHAAQDQGLPWFARRIGKAGVADFFASLSGLEFHAFEPKTLLSGDRHAAGLVLVDVTVKATGRRVRDEELHLFTFDEAGKIIGFRHYLDTARHIQAYW